MNRYAYYEAPSSALGLRHQVLDLLIGAPVAAFGTDCAARTHMALCNSTARTDTMLALRICLREYDDMQASGDRGALVTAGGADSPSMAAVRAALAEWDSAQEGGAL